MDTEVPASLFPRADGRVRRSTPPTSNDERFAVLIDGKWREDMWAKVIATSKTNGSKIYECPVITPSGELLVFFFCMTFHCGTPYTMMPKQYVVTKVEDVDIFRRLPKPFNFVLFDWKP